MSEQRFRRPPLWMSEAYLLSDSRVPERLAAGPVIPVAEISGGGWGLGDVRPISWTIGASEAVATWDLETGEPADQHVGDRRWQYILWGIECVNNMAESLDVRVALNTGGTGFGVTLRIGTIAPTVSAEPDPTTQDFFGDLPFLYCPPGFKFVLRPGAATGVGESIEFHMALGRYPAGFKVI